MNSILEAFENLPKIVKVLLFLFVGVISPIYRILRWVDTKNNTTLIVGIIGFFLPLWIVDLVTEITSNRVTVCAD